MRNLPSRNTNSSKRQRETKVEQRHERGQGFEQVQPQQKVQSGQPRPPSPPPKPNFRGLSQALGGGSSQGLVIQPKLTIGAPNDKYEQEADRIAVQIVQQINTPKVEQGQSAQAIQRETLLDKDGKLQVKPDVVQPTALLEEEVQAKLAPVARSLTAYPRVCDLQMKSLPVLVQQEAIDDEADLQMKPARSRGVVAGNASADLESAINSSRGSGQPLDLGLQQQIGQAMGANFQGVTVHTDATADRLNRSIQAKAFTTGKDIFFRSGVYNPGSREGQELIAHELTHLVQQNGNSVQLKKGFINRKIQNLPTITRGGTRRTEIAKKTAVYNEIDQKKDVDFFKQKKILEELRNLESDYIKDHEGDLSQSKVKEMKVHHEATKEELARVNEQRARIKALGKTFKLNLTESHPIGWKYFKEFLAEKYVGENGEYIDAYLEAEKKLDDKNTVSELVEKVEKWEINVSGELRNSLRDKPTKALFKEVTLSVVGMLQSQWLPFKENAKYMYLISVPNSK